MVPGGSRLSRRARSVAIAFVVATLLAPLRSAAADPAEPRYAGGDAGTGIPALALDEPRVLQRSAVRWADVSSTDAWARPAIDYVAGTKNWMRDFRAADDGTTPFKPSAITKRKHFARAVVRAFAPDAMPDPSVLFSDLDPSSPFWRFANVAVSKGWIAARSGGAFQPDQPVTMTAVHRALVLARGLRPAVRSLNAIRTADGTKIKVPSSFGTNVLGMRMNLRYPSKYEDNDVHPWTPMPRIQVAYSLYRAAQLPSSTISYLAGQYRRVVLPRMGEGRRAIVQWGVRYAGFPYVWGGEWGLKTPAPSALGGQSIPGFDCSGYAWWLMRRNDGGAWKVAPPRPYRGWSLPERSSALMAGATSNRLKYDQLKPGDLMFYDGDGDRVVDHVDVYVGNGWALDSSTSPAGVTLMWVGTGWYRDHFVHGRRLIG